ncbi:MAG: hypothetical protein DRI44_03955 [Chlamydiae bacterium]|nr:MAG: hypothetical protein DRI44_03955 [Chlamydiota bacterium]
MKKLLAFVTITTLMAVSAQAATIWWCGTRYGGNGYYTNGFSWKVGGVDAPYGTPPQSFDERGLINNGNGDHVTMPIIDCFITNDYVPVMLGVGSDGPGTLTVTNGGSIIAHQLVIGRGAGTGAGKLYITGGNMEVEDSIEIGISPNKGEVIISQNGFLHLDNTPSFSYNNSNSVINILDTSVLWIDGDQTDFNFVDNGFITTTDPGNMIKEFYNETEERTEYTVIPEPVILGLMSLLGLFFLRRR